jgi:DNA repair protein RecO (recombination protein O)
MPLLRGEAIVLHTRDLGETDRLVTLYTRDHGKLTAVARGARRIRSRFAGALELFTWGDLVGFEREGRNLVQLDHFDIRRPFRRLREDLDRLGQGARMVEAVTRLTDERDPQPASFGLLLRGLRALESGPPTRVHLAFALRLLDLLGHRPQLDRCSACGRRVATDGLAFDPGEGTVRCGSCGPGGGLAMAPTVAAALRGLQAASWEARLTARIALGVEVDAAALLDRYLSVLIGAPLRVPRFLAQARSPAGPG